MRCAIETGRSAILTMVVSDRMIIT